MQKTPKEIIENIDKLSYYKTNAPLTGLHILNIPQPITKEASQYLKDRGIEPTEIRLTTPSIEAFATYCAISELTENPDFLENDQLDIIKDTISNLDTLFEKSSTYTKQIKEKITSFTFPCGLSGRYADGTFTHREEDFYSELELEIKEFPNLEMITMYTCRCGIDSKENRMKRISKANNLHHDVWQVGCYEYDNEKISIYSTITPNHEAILGKELDSKILRDKLVKINSKLQDAKKILYAN
jgi:hypothetical protein